MSRESDKRLVDMDFKDLMKEARELMGYGKVTESGVAESLLPRYETLMTGLKDYSGCPEVVKIWDVLEANIYDLEELVNKKKEKITVEVYGE